ncbi:isocitrate lyase/phosphoenolpyruvate mutase family protein [Kordia sp. YSTF-M3]|uniref:Isocitrate lyase/phosphoenolpyruvate mutase family protein n=1 Tax=Kordia aestuariivivens TaxID=2759037 RepID=A0ABR7QAZ1_9FLAO|nr:isocitrate lyase/phosphoenolpyruvate mutase family protein [Kordia aestuariivivens]MBC8755747.1 isocitrate lyase/phosphoenolpyruvate mutase family protein [Kordia aestuariivivens]
MEFKQLHQQKTPLLIYNVWDVPSAKVAEKLNAKAIGTSSSAIAQLLGYNDGEELSFSELEYIVKRISANTKLSLSVDLEAGYSRNPAQIVQHITKLHNLGVVGINIEDSIVDEERTLLDAAEFSKTLSEITSQLQKDKIEIFINVRTDTFLLNVANVLEETKKRIKLYENAGASGIFIPCIEKEADIKLMTETTKLPINVLCMPKLPNFNILKQVGVQRISMGNFLFDHMYNQLEKMSKEIITQQSFNAIF